MSTGACGSWALSQLDWRLLSFLHLCWIKWCYCRLCVLIFCREELVSWNGAPLCLALTYVGRICCVESAKASPLCWLRWDQYPHVSEAGVSGFMEFCFGWHISLPCSTGNIWAVDLVGSTCPTLARHLTEMCPETWKAGEFDLVVWVRTLGPCCFHVCFVLLFYYFFKRIFVYVYI